MNYGDVFWADLPDRRGREQRGRRPVIIWQDTSQFALPTVLIIPLTTQPGAARFAGTALIQPTPLNGLASPSVALVFQLGACDTGRLGTRLGRLDDPDLVRLQGLAKQLQRLP
jgi:mRNA-degrading endonuclease toxin of MazEF toxin-antitoxin module